MAEVYSTPVPGSGSDVILLDSPYKINWFKAAIAGILGALGLLLVHFLVYFGYGVDSLNLPLLFGSFLTDNYVGAQLLGIGAVIGVYMVAALAYAYILWLFRFQSNHGKGTMYGVLIGIAMYAFVFPWTVGLAARWGAPHVTSSFLPNMDVMINQAGHGNVGWEAVCLVLLPQIIYGLLIGITYRHEELPIGGRYRLRYIGD